MIALNCGKLFKMFSNHLSKWKKWTIFIFNLWFQWSIALEKQFSNELENLPAGQFKFHPHILLYFPSHGHLDIHLFFISTSSSRMICCLKPGTFVTVFLKILFYIHVPTHSMIHQHFWMNGWYRDEFKFHF